MAGATGVLGRALVPRLLSCGHSVRAIARRPSNDFCRHGLELIKSDLLVDDLFELVFGCEAVVHIATAIPRDSSAPGAWGQTWTGLSRAAPCRETLKYSALLSASPTLDRTISSLFVRSNRTSFFGFTDGN